MGKFVKKILIYIFAFFFIAIMPCIIIDPYSVFHPFNVKDNGVEPNKNFIKMVYIKHNPDKFDAFIFGSSLAGMVNAEKILDSKCYNMTHSGGVLPEFEANLRTMIDFGMTPKKIFIGLESNSYSDIPQNRNGDRMRASYEFAKQNPIDFWTLYLDPAVNIDAIRTVISTNNISDLEKEAYTRVFYENGGYPYYGFSWEYDEENEGLELKKSKEQFRKYIETNRSGLESSPKPDLYMEEALNSMREIVKLCNENGIELTVFINPMFYGMFEDAVVNMDFLGFLKKLASITPFYNFSGYNSFTEDPSFYHEDKAHFLVELGDIMIDNMCNGICDEELLAQGFGVYVTEYNIDGLIEILENALIED